MKHGRTLAAVTIAVLFATTAVFFVMDQPSLNSLLNPFQQYYVPNLLTTTFSRNYSFSSDPSGTGNYYLFMTLPQNSSLQSGYISIAHSKNVGESISQTNGMIYSKFTMNPGREYVNFSYHFNSYGKDWQNVVSESGNVSQIPNSLKTEYDHPEFFNLSQNQSYEVINPSEFKNLTLSITGNETTVAGKLRAIYDYIVNNYHYNITYNLNNVPLTSYQVYQGKIGDCEELSYLFESMSRSIGIPSWTQYGLLIQKQNGVYTIGNHAWVETYIPVTNGSGYYVNIDLTVEVGQSDLGIGFLIKYPDAITEWSDDGNSSAMVNFHKFLEYPEFGLGTISHIENDSVQSYSLSGQTIINTNIHLSFAAEVKIE